MILSRVALGALVVGGLLTVGCSKKDSAEDSSGAAPSATPSAAKPTTTPTTAVTTVTPPVSHEAEASSVRACCAALRSAAAAASPSEKSKYESAAASCDGIAVVVRNGASTRQSAMGQVRAALRGGTPPAGCN